MKTGFKDPCAIKKQHPKDAGKSLGFDFTCPQYDERTGRGVDAGTHYGVGHRQPVGSLKYTTKGEIPKGRVNTLKDDVKG